MLRPQPLEPVPDETARVARAAFPAGNLYMRMRDALGTLYEDTAFAPLFSPQGRPAAAAWRLALVTVVQFAEDLSDRQAADAVRARIDLKYALALPLEDAGFDHTVLSEFRSRLVAGEAAHVLLEALLERCRRLGLVKAHGRQRTDSTHVLAAVRALNRLELVRETLGHTLEVLAGAVPDWLRAHALPEWVTRYRGRSDELRLPKGKAAQQALAHTIGADGATLLEAISSPAAPPWLREVPAVETLRRVWVQNYFPTTTGLRWRTAAEGIPKATQFVSSPHDGDAHLAAKGTLAWVGYKVALTETCEDDAPNLITHVETVPGPIADGTLTPRVHRALQQQGRLPRVHLVDSGFLDAELLVASRRDFGVDLLGPTRKDQRWQARAAGGFGVEHFVVDWAQRRVTCPAGHTSIQWTPRRDSRDNDSIYVRFSPSDCGPCPSLRRCTQSAEKHPRRSLALRPQAQYEALRQRRDQEGSDTFAREYARRAGIEGTLSQGVRRCGLRRTRYVGLPRTHLGHVATAAALNFVRVAEWLAGTPRARTRGSRFARLMAQP